MTFTTRAMINWIDRMVEQFCPAILDIESGQFWDWGQAVARELYGLEGMAQAPPDPPLESMNIMKRWERGEFPEWMRVGQKVEKAETVQ